MELDNPWFIWFHLIKKEEHLHNAVCNPQKKVNDYRIYILGRTAPLNAL